MFLCFRAHDNDLSKTRNLQVIDLKRISWPTNNPAFIPQNTHTLIPVERLPVLYVATGTNHKENASGPTLQCPAATSIFVAR